MGVNLVPSVDNFAVTRETFTDSSHDVLDGAVTPGAHRLLRFDFLLHNAGDTDLVAGAPADRPDLFVLSAGHNHYHLRDFNEFKLFNASGQEVAIGYKQAFCLEDHVQIDPLAKADAQFTDCNVAQGLSAGWADVYEASLPGQYIVIDGLPSGDYTLQATPNSQQAFAEDNYSDNTIRIGLRLDGDNVAWMA